MSETESSESTDQQPSETIRPLLLWMLTTIVAAVLLALLFGSATPRIRLLGIFPLAIGAFSAFGAMSLMDKFELKISKFSFVWILLISTVVVAGSTCWSWQLWQKQLTRDHAVALARINALLQNAAPEQQAQIRRENLLRFREAITFSAYLSDRLTAFSDQIGNKKILDSPVPETVFGVELCLALVGAWVVVVQGSKELSEE